MNLGVTGHRPDKLGGYDKQVDERLRQLAAACLLELKSLLPSTLRVTSGMAPGWDQAIVEACIALDIPFNAALPFIGQEAPWPRERQVLYHNLLGHAERVVYVSKGAYTVWKLMVCNVYIVDNTDRILTLWNGEPSGTANTVRYAEEVGVPVTNVWERWVSEFQ